MSKSKIFLSFLIVFVIIFLAVNLVKKRQKQLLQEKTPERPVYLVNGVVVEKGALETKRSFIGKIQPVLQAEISTNQAGYINDIYVKENQYVKEGQLLVQIDDTPVKLEIQNLKISLDILTNQLKTLKSQEQSLKLSVDTLSKIFLRNKELFENNALPEEKLELSRVELEKAKSSYVSVLQNIKITQEKINQTKNQIKIKENQLKYLKITAPFNAVVSKVYLKEGSFVAPGKPILKIYNPRKLKVLVSVPPDVKVKKGQNVVVKVDTESINSSVSKVLKEADKNSLNIVEIIISKPVKIGKNAIVFIPVKYEEGFKLPVDAVLFEENKSFVLKASDNRFEKVPVKILATDGKFVIVDGKLKENDVVAVAKESKLRLLSAGIPGKIVLRGEK